MYKKRKQAAVLLLSWCILLGITAYYGPEILTNHILQRESDWSQAEDVIYARIDAGLWKTETVSLWWNEKQDKYDLFLPSFWNEGDGLQFTLSNKKILVIDGKELPPSGKMEGLTIGRHTLSVGGADSDTYELEVFCSANLPALFLSMPDASAEALYETPYENQPGSFMQLFDEDGRLVARQTVSGFRVRGNTSADWPKKPYQMTLSQGMDLLGMGSATKWNLLSNYSDKTLLRNQIAYSLGERAGIAYTARSRYVDLFLNGEYQGNYQLFEKVEIAPNRVNIRDLEDYTLFDDKKMMAESYAGDVDPQEVAYREERMLENGMTVRGFATTLGTEDLTGGYLLEVERPSRVRNGFSYFITAGGQPVTVKRPKFADWQEVTYIGELWQNFENALFSENGVDGATGTAYTDYIDKESFVRKYLLEEIVRNYDASSTSQYFYKDTDNKDPLIHAGPVWDYDMSLGNPVMRPETNQNYISSVSPYGLFAALPMDDFSIWYRLMSHQDFEEDVKRCYREVFLPILKEMEEHQIKACAEDIRESAIMDGVRWDRNEGADAESRKNLYQKQVEGLLTFVEARESYLTGLWVDARETKKVYLDPGNADSYVSYVENLIGEQVEMPPEPVMEGYTFEGWLNGYTLEPYDFSTPLTEDNLYLVAKYKNNDDGSTVIAGQ